MGEFSLQTVGPIRGCAVLQVAGEVDVYTAPMLREQIRELAAKGAVHLSADLGRVDFLDSTGLGALAGGLKRLRQAGGSLALVISTPRVLRIFQITGLTKALGGRRDHCGPALAAGNRNRSRKRSRMVPAARPVLTSAPAMHHRHSEGITGRPRVPRTRTTPSARLS